MIRRYLDPHGSTTGVVWAPSLDLDVTKEKKYSVLCQ